MQATKRALGWPEEPPFFVPDEALAEFRKALDRGAAWEEEWSARFRSYEQHYPDDARLWSTVMAGELPAGWDAAVPSFEPADGALATRAASGKVLNGLVQGLPTLLGGSADLAPSTNTYLLGYGDVGLDEFFSHNMHFGVREHAMGNIVNGLALHGGVIPYGATFLIFSDYMRPALRLAALQGLPVVFIFTHDSIGLGEDGPTHQPIEQLAALRAIPGLTVYRPADANETAECWRLAVERREPSAFALSRQGLPVLDPSEELRAGVRRGGYVLRDSEGRPDAILIATGSEVAVALGARELLAERGLQARVVSIPSWELFEEQPPAYRERDPAARRGGARLGRGRLLAGLAAATWATRARSSRSTISARRRRPSACSRSSASRPRPSRSAPRPSSEGGPALASEAAGPLRSAPDGAREARSHAPEEVRT